MRFPFFAVIPAFVLLFFLAYGQPNGANVQSEEVIRQKLAAEAPGAVEMFGQGSAAMDKGDYREAAPPLRGSSQAGARLLHQASAISALLARSGR